MSFDTVRDTMYKYSKQAQDRFFAHPTYAFLFLYFRHSKSGKHFAAAKFDENGDPRHSERMCKEVAQLADEAKKCLNENQSQLARQLATFFSSKSALATGAF